MTLKKLNVLDTGFWVLLFLLPILPQYIYVVSGVNVVNFAAAAFVALFLLLGKIRFVQMPKSMWFFWIFVLAQSVFALSDAGFLRMVTYLLTCVAVPYILILFLNTRERFYRALDVLIGAGAVIGIFGILESLTKTNLFQQFANGAYTDFFFEIRYGLLRIMTTFGQPIGYGIYQCFIATFVLYRLSCENTLGTKRLLKVAYVIAVLNVFLTVSRIPILMLVLIHLLFLLKQSKKKMIFWTAVLLLVLVLLVLVGTLLEVEIPLIDDLITTLQSVIGGTSTDDSTAGIGNRLELFNWVAQSMHGSWILGRGFEAPFAYEVNDWQVKTSIENGYLSTLYHTGIVGLVTMLLSYFGIWYFNRREGKQPERLEGEGHFSFAAVLSILFLTYYVGALGTQETDMTRMFVITVALGVVYSRVRNLQKTQQTEENTLS